MTKLKIAIGVVVVAGAAMFWTVQHQTQVRLRAENESLQRQLEQMAQLEADNERLSNLVAQAKSPLSNEQLMELLKLRGEVGLLRQQTKELQPLREQNQKLQATNSPTKVPPLAVYPKASWAFAGYATPEAAFQSLNWAAANGDVNKFLDGLTPDLQKLVAKEFENKSETEIVNQIKSGINKNTGFSILKEDVHSDNEVVLTISGDAEGDNTPHNVVLVFQKIDGQWKLAGH